MWESRSSNIASSNHGSRLFFGCQNTWNKNPLVSRGFTSFNKKTRGIPKKAKEQSIDPKKTWPFWIIELKCVKQLELRHHKASQWWGGDEVISFFLCKNKISDLKHMKTWEEKQPRFQHLYIHIWPEKICLLSFRCHSFSHHSGKFGG